VGTSWSSRSPTPASAFPRSQGPPLPGLEPGGFLHRPTVRGQGLAWPSASALTELMGGGSWDGEHRRERAPPYACVHPDAGSHGQGCAIARPGATLPRGQERSSSWTTTGPTRGSSPPDRGVGKWHPWRWPSGLRRGGRLAADRRWGVLRRGAPRHADAGMDGLAFTDRLASCPRRPGLPWSW